MHSRDVLERSILGGILLRPDVLALIPHLESDDFAGFRARATWDAMRTLEAEGRPIDPTTVVAELEHTGKLEAVGEVFLADCALQVPTPEHVVEYATSLRDLSLVARIVTAASHVAAEAKRLNGADLLALAYSELSKLSVDTPDKATPIGQLVRARMGELEQIAARRAAGGSAMTGYPTGSPKLDALTGGWQPWILQIIAARPAMGKSSMALASADACSAAGHGVHEFSLEDGPAVKADRAMARDALVSATKIRAADLTRDEMGRLGQSMGRLWKRRNWLVDTRSGLTPDEVIRSVRRRRAENDTKLVIVDYAQKLRAPRSLRLDPGEETMSYIVETLADAATQDGLAYVLCSQLNRECEKRVDKRPTASDLRGSGALEQCAKIIVGLYRGAKYFAEPQREIDWDCDCTDRHCELQHKPSADEFERTIQLCVIKQNQGAEGVIYERWDGPTTRVG